MAPTHVGAAKKTKGGVAGSTALRGLTLLMVVVSGVYIDVALTRIDFDLVQPPVLSTYCSNVHVSTTSPLPKASAVQ